MFNCSDLVINVDGKAIRAHKFVLKARSDHWGVDLDTISELSMPGGIYLLISIVDVDEHGVHISILSSLVNVCNFVCY